MVLAVSVVLAVCAMIPMLVLAAISRTFAAMACCGLVSSLVAGLLFRVGVEPVAWRRMCQARNVALCILLVFSVLDVAGFIALTASLAAARD